MTREQFEWVLFYLLAFAGFFVAVAALILTQFLWHV